MENLTGNQIIVRNSISKKIRNTILFILIGAGIILLLIIYFTLSNLLENSFKNEAKVMTEILAHSISRDWYYLNNNVISDKARVQKNRNKSIISHYFFRTASLNLFPNTDYDINDAHLTKEQFQKFMLDDSLESEPILTYDGAEFIYSIAVNYAPERSIDREASKEFLGVIAIKFSKVELNIAIYRILFTIGLVSLLGLIIIFFLLNYRLNNIFRPLSEIAKKTYEMSKGNLIEYIRYDRDDEIGILTDAFNTMARNLRAIIKQINDLSIELKNAMALLTHSSKNLNEVSNREKKNAQSTLKLVMNMKTSTDEIEKSAEELNQSAVENSSSIHEMRMSMEEVENSTDNLSQAVEETSSSIDQMMRSIQQVNSNVNSLWEAMETTMSSITEISSSIKQVESNTEEASKFSEQVSKEAGLGMETVQKNIMGMENIKKSVEDSSKIIKNLFESSKEIGEILDVIDDIAAQTNLLALNAAIIAAQAGEHGKGFVVVADEIRSLSEKTASSTNKISKLIKTFQTEADSAQKSMDDVIVIVNEGVNLSKNSGRALDRILNSSNKSKDMSKQIVIATVEQAKGSRQVFKSVYHIKEMTSQIRTATQEQDSGSRLIEKATVNMRDNTDQVRRAIVEQGKGSRAISKATEEVKENTESIWISTKKQTDLSDDISNAMMKIVESIDENMKIIDETNKSVNIINKQIQLLENEMNKFNL